MGPNIQRGGQAQVWQLLTRGVSAPTAAAQSPPGMRKRCSMGDAVMDLDDAITYLESVDGREERWPPGCSHTFAGVAHELARRLRECQSRKIRRSGPVTGHGSASSARPRNGDDPPTVRHRRASVQRRAGRAHGRTVRYDSTTPALPWSPAAPAELGLEAAHRRLCQLPGLRLCHSIEQSNDPTLPKEACWLLNGRLLSTHCGKLQTRGTIVNVTRVVSLRLDQEDSEALAAVGRGSGGAYLRRLLLSDLKERRRGCDHARHWRGRCADCGAALPHRVNASAASVFPIDLVGLQQA